MKTSISLNDFTNCSTLQNAFSYDGLVALFDYIEDYVQSCGTGSNSKSVALCCEFTEYATYQAIADCYSDLDGDTPEKMLEWLRDRTQVIEFKTGVILQDF